MINFGKERKDLLFAIRLERIGCAYQSRTIKILKTVSGSDAFLAAVSECQKPISKAIDIIFTPEQRIINVEYGSEAHFALQHWIKMGVGVEGDNSPDQDSIEQKQNELTRLFSLIIDEYPRWPGEHDKTWEKIKSLGEEIKRYKKENSQYSPDPNRTDYFPRTIGIVKDLPEEETISFPIIKDGKLASRK